MNIQYLTVDADAHLRKLTSNYYRSQVLNIIELIRSSLKRDASKVKLKLDKKTIIIEDNGIGLSQKQIIRFKNIVDLRKSHLEREDEILSFIEEFGIDILVIFSFQPLDIKIENIYNKEKDKIIIKVTGVSSEKTNSIKSGTRIIIKRKNADLKIENRIITEYCRNIGNKVQINGKQVIKRPIIQDMIVSVNIRQYADQDIAIGIAISGELCKLWTHHDGIPVSVKTIPNVNGYVFEVINNKVLTGSTINELSKSAAKLYAHLVKQYEFYPADIKKRVKELIYKHYNITKSRLFIDSLNSFKIFGKNKEVNINFLKEISKSKKIYAALNKKDLKKTDTAGKIILFLDQLDIDLLVNSFKINIIFLQEHSSKIRIKEFFLLKLINRIKTFISKKLLNTNKVSTLSRDETIFIREISSYLLKDKQFKSLYPEAKKIKIKMVNQRLLVQAYTTISDEIVNIHISKKHKKIKKVIKLFNSDKKNIEWLLPQILF